MRIYDLSSYRAIVRALTQGFTSKTSARQQAYRALRADGQYITKSELASKWSFRVHEGRIAKRGRTWHVVEGEAP